MTDSERVIVVGGGLGGLTAACTLAARGYRVRLYERNEWLGGKAAELAAGGFRFDMGPTILTVPRVIERVFAEAGEQSSDHLDLVRLDPQWRCFYDDGTHLDLRESPEAMADVLRAFCDDGNGGGDAAVEQYRQFVAHSDRLAEISELFYLWQPVSGISDMIRLRYLPHMHRLFDMRMGATVAGNVRRYAKDPRVAQMLDHFTQYVGSDPYQAPAILCSIASLQLNEGVWYPMGGTRAVPVALAALAERLGVELVTGTGVDQLTTSGGRVTGVVTSAGETVAAAAVVSNMDAVRTHRELLTDLRGGGAAARWQRKTIEPACSGVVLYLGLDRKYEQLAHHDFVFSRDPEEEFDAIYHRGEPAPDPTCYLCAPSVTEPGVAPDGGEALYILVHAPHLRPGQDWRAMLPGYRQVILDKLQRTAGLDDLESHIVMERALTPQDIHDRYHVLDGAIYGVASHGRFLGAFKPGNRSPDARGLYLAGGAAHPGPGMPMAMMSGWIAADALDRDRVAKTTSAAVG